jgi:ankyrin repeat protein
LHLHDLLKGVQLEIISAEANKGMITADKTAYALSQVASQDYVRLPFGQRSQLLSIVFEHIVTRCVNIVLASEHLAMELFAKKSIDKIAAQLDAVIPETFQDENLQRATTMVSGCKSEIMIETIRMIIYLISNRLLMGSTAGISFRKDREIFISLCRLSGLSRPLVVRQIVEISRQSPTLAAVVDAMFDAAVHTSAADVVSTLLSADSRIHVDRPVTRHTFLGNLFFCDTGRKTPLSFALSCDSYDMATVLLDAGADMYAHDQTMLPLALLRPPSHPSNKLIELLLQRGIAQDLRCSRDCDLSLAAAIIMGNYSLIKTLIEAGSNINFRLPTPTWPCFYGSTLLFRGLKDVGFLGCAICFNRVQLFEDFDSLETQISHDECQRGAMDICRWFLNNYGSCIEFSPEMTTDSMIIAARQNYTEVISFLYHSFRVPVNHWNGYTFPLYEAIREDQLDACQLLLHLGASTDLVSLNTTNRLTDNTTCRLPSLLHLAVISATHHDKCHILQLLIKQGAQIDQTMAYCLNHTSTLSTSEYCNKSCEIVHETPFRFALRTKKACASALLLAAGATATNLDLLIAAERGYVELVQQLVQRRQPPMTVAGVESAFRAALFNSHSSVATILAKAGAHPMDDDFSSLFRTFDITSIQAMIPQYLLSTPTKMIPSLDGKIYLENAILSANEKVIEYALSLDDKVYKSEALLSVVLLSAQNILSNGSMIIQELLRRRDNILGWSGYNPILENTALSITIAYKCFGLFSTLLRNVRPDMISQSSLLPRYENYPTDRLLRGQIPLSLGDDSPDWNCKRIDNYGSSHKSLHPEVSPLFFAVSSHNVDLVQSLLTSGYMPDGFTLRAAILQRLPFSIIRSLIENCSDIDAECALKLVDTELCTPLCIATRRGEVRIVRALLDHNAEIDRPGRRKSRTSSTSTALKEAVEANNLELVCCLLDRGANVNEPAWSPQNPFEETSLQIAAKQGYIGIVKVLLAHGADANARRHPKYGYTALEAAASFGRLDTVQLLLNFGVETKKLGRVQYVRAILLSTAKGFHAVRHVLRSHRKWTTKDKAIGDEICDSRRTRNRTFLHKEEHSALEFLNLITRLHEEEGVTLIWEGANMLRLSHGDRTFSNWRTMALVESQKWLAEYKVAYSHVTDEALEEAATAVWQALVTFARHVGPEFCDRGEFHGNGLDNISNESEFFSGGQIDGSKEDLIFQRAKRLVLEALESWKSSHDIRISSQARGIDTRQKSGVFGSGCQQIVDMTDSMSMSAGCSRSMGLSAEREGSNWDWSRFNTTEMPGSKIETETESWDDRRKIILKDMLGEAEAPFEPQEFML